MPLLADGGLSHRQTETGHHSSLTRPAYCTYAPRAAHVLTMPILASSAPRQLQELNMDSKTRNPKGCNLRYRLQCRSSGSSKTEGLNFTEVSQWSHSLERLLVSKYGTVTFQTFLKSEYSDENIEFWLVCEDYKKLRSSFRMSSRAKKIFKRYIQAGAPREINIDQKTRELIRRNVNTPTEACFVDAQRIVYGLMERDSYPRFLRSDMYRTLGSRQDT